jgi:peptidoglycan/xylan/chitin deacetylase (PgdA/CDA1 family)
MKLALKIDVDTLRGTREGAPGLVEMLRRHQAGATFVFGVGPDLTGRAALELMERGVASYYGVRSLLYGTLLPAPDIGRRAGDVMRRVRDAGFETGLRAFAPVRWQSRAADAGAAWTEAEMQRGVDRYADVLGVPPALHAAAGWQTNVHALRMTQRLAFDYASDGRGTHPFLPVWRGELIRCPQFPTTLPTLDELLAQDGVSPDSLAAHLLERTALPPAAGHVFTLRAEFEGGKLAPVMEQLLVGWKAQGYELVPLRALVEAVEPLALPRCEIEYGTVPGRRGTVMLQGGEFLADVELANAA